MPSQDPRIVELSNLKKKVLEIETQLREEKKVSLRLREASEKKIEQVNVVDSEIAAEMERFRWKKEEILFQIKTTEEDIKAKISSLKQKSKDLLTDIADYDVQAAENQRLQSRLKTISQEYQKTLKEQVEERNHRAQKNFDTRMAMEEIMRKMVKNVDSTYENNAISRMKTEASQAHVENERIHREFDIREAKTEALIRQQQQSYDLLMRLRIELDMMTISTDIQEKNILKFIKQNRKTEKEVIAASARVQQLRDQVLALDIAYKGKQNLEQEIKVIRGQSADLLTSSQKYRRMSIQIAHKILSETLVIGDKSRMQLSRQITQQLSELSTESDGKPPTPPSRGAFTPLLDTHVESDKDLATSSYFFPTNPVPDFENIWRQSQNQVTKKNMKLASSFSMMFSGN